MRGVPVACIVPPPSIAPFIQGGDNADAIVFCSPDTVGRIVGSEPLTSMVKQ